MRENHKMHILISNDDGIFANGIRALAKACVAAGHRVTIFAPDAQRSAASHSMSIYARLTATPVEYDGIPAYAVNGTPADCVRLGLYLCGADRVDCVLSGINNGSNRGAAILYSGTVGAAMEASLCGVPAVAVSLCGHEELYGDGGYDFAARLGVKTMEWAMAHPLPQGDIYNLNVPRCENVKAVKSATVSRDYIMPPVYQALPEGGYRVDDHVDAGIAAAAPHDSDLWLTKNGYASLSIIGWNMLSAEPMPDLSGLNGEMFQ